MSELNNESDKNKKSLSSRISKLESRKLKAKKRGIRNVWFGFGFMGLIGWSIVLPTVVGILIGLWIDKHFPGKYSWTLTLLFLGLSIGCFNVWRWITNENKEIHNEEKEDHD